MRALRWRGMDAVNAVDASADTNRHPYSSWWYDNLGIGGKELVVGTLWFRQTQTQTQTQTHIHRRRHTEGVASPDL